jgi:hypothetical protein
LHDLEEITFGFVDISHRRYKLRKDRADPKRRGGKGREEKRKEEKGEKGRESGGKRERRSGEGKEKGRRRTRVG